jgi:hypothetical protein
LKSESASTVQTFHFISAKKRASNEALFYYFTNYAFVSAGTFG